MKQEAREKKERQQKCLCPYCEEEIFASPLPVCQPCGVILRYCPGCKIVVGREASVCPQCGGKLE